MTKLPLLLLLVGLIQHALVAPTLDHNIVNKLRQSPTINVIVSMKDSTQSVLSNLRLQTFTTREDRLNGVARALQDFAANSQKSVLDLLNTERANKNNNQPFSFTVLWITNQIFIKMADMDILTKLAALDDISKIEEEKSIRLDDPIDLQVVDNLGLAAEDDEVQWGVKQIEAPTLWKEGNKGQNVTIATCDTGARGTHETLRDNFAGDYGWFDPSGQTLTPNDGNGHGTHTTANIAGNLRNVGVAPGSTWAACKGCGSIFCSQSDLLACGQFFVCPTKPDGSAPNCAKAPHLVSNSWGGGSGSDWYRPVIEAYHAARIIPLFSAGNSGPSCGSANSPGDYDNLIGVGSTTIDNQLSSFSSVGPTVIGGRMKPEIAAPGSNVFSAYHTSDTAYASMSGTSMACPHAAGVVALLLHENPNLTYSQVLASVTGGGVPTTGTGMNCGDVSEDVYPNHHVGHGRINAVKTIASMHRLLQIQK